MTELHNIDIIIVQK